MASFLNWARMSVSGTPGTGTVTLAGAIAKFLSLAEEAEAEALRSMAAAIKSLRAASNLMEEDPPSDYAADERWRVSPALSMLERICATSIGRRHLYRPATRLSRPPGHRLRSRAFIFRFHHSPLGPCVSTA
jgi:hypothetical protein